VSRDAGDTSASRLFCVTALRIFIENRKGYSVATENPGSMSHVHDTLAFDRLVFFSDAVLAIAITLMALEVRVPEGARLADALDILSSRLVMYVVSFLVIGVYWALHHRLFRLIHTIDGRLIWLNLAFLMFAALVPASTSLLREYGGQRESVIVYAVSVSLLGMTEFLIWVYAQKRELLEEISPRVTRYIGLRILLAPTIFLVSIPIALLNPLAAELSWIFIAPLHVPLRHFFREEHRERSEIYGERPG